MEPKRRKLSPSAAESSGPAARLRPSRRRGLKEISEVTEEHLTSEDAKVIKTALHKLKKTLNTADSVKIFLITKVKFQAVCNIFAKETAKLGTESVDSELLQQSVSVLANCCNISTPACLEMKQSCQKFADYAVRIFENTSTTSEIKATLCRLIANLCAHKETAHWVSNSFLWDRVCLLLESDHMPTVTQAVRAVRSLVNLSFTRVIMLANVGFYLGKLLANSQVRNDVIKILHKLLGKHRKDLDRQLATSECAEQLISMFFAESTSDDLTPAQELTVELCVSCVAVREQLETAEGIIARLLECENKGKIRMLASFAQTAWGRAKLRQTGGLDLLADTLSTSDSLDERKAIVNAFRHFIHDTTGMSHLSANKTFVETVLRDVNDYLEKYKSVCTPEVDEEYVLRLHAKSVVRQKQKEVSVSADQGESERLHKDFHSMWAYETPSPSPRRHSSPFQCYSPPYSIPSSRNSVASSSPIPSYLIASPNLTVNTTEADFEAVAPADLEEEKDDSSMRWMIEGELWLLTYQSQDDVNLTYLIRPDVVDCVISYLRFAKKPDFRNYRILRRMATSRTFVEKLLDMQFHSRVLSGLCAPPCRMLKYAKRCARCESCAEHGREVLREFASHVDSDFGHAFLLVRLDKEEFVAKTKAAIAKVALIRDQMRIIKRLPTQHQTALDWLFEALKQMLASAEDFDEKGAVSTYDNGPSLCSQIIGSMSSLLTAQRIRELCENDSWYVPPSEDSGTCEIKKAAKNVAEEKLSFEDSKGDLLAAVPMSAACSASLYFEGMFSADFSEKHNQVRTFEVDEATEGCSLEEFRIFLHLLAGCTSACTSVADSKQCAALLQLSDHYLSSSISTSLCSLDGPVRRFMKGESLDVLLPLALTLNAHDSLLDTTFLCLVRYTQPDDVTAALCAVSRRPHLTSTFLAKFRTFLGK